MLKILAEKGDVKTLDLLAKSGILPSDLGLWDEHDQKLMVVSYGILSEDINKLKFSHRVFELTPGNEAVLYEAKLALRKLNSKNSEVKKGVISFVKRFRTH
jgi:hypothetical protein